MKNIAIIGSGSFGCALANTLIKNNNVKIWSFKEEEKLAINNEHRCIFIENSKLDEKIKCYTNYKEAIDASDYIFIVTPSNVIRKTLEDIKKYIQNQKIIIASKGIEKNTNKLLTEVAKEVLNNKVGVLSGPSIAKELINDEPGMVIFASKNNEFNEEVKDLFENTNLKIETSNDVIGTELGGALKNIVALASGILDGLNLGQNIKSVLITKGLNEMKEIGVKIGAKEDTFYGLSGLGDLIVTSLSDNSRNHTAGKILAKGKTLGEVKNEVGMVIEGFEALEIAESLSKKHNINLPIINTLYKIIYEEKDIKTIIKAIMEG